MEHQEIDFEINGLHDGSELPQIVSLWFKGCQSDALLTNLDLNGIAASAGSACTAGSLEPSHVLTAMYGKDSPKVSESLRFSFGRYNTEEEVERIIEVLSKTIKRMKKRQVINMAYGQKQSCKAIRELLNYRLKSNVIRCETLVLSNQRAENSHWSVRLIQILLIIKVSSSR